MTNKTYYIWPEMREYNKILDDRSDRVRSPFHNYALATKEGAFHGEGHCCGYYGNTWIEDAGVIAQGYSKYIGAKETDADVFNLKYEYIIERCEDRRIKDCYTGPFKFEAENDEEAIDYFYDYCITKNALEG